MTPMMQQYLATKEKYKDCVIFFRLGDFYEMFFEDARVVSKQLDLVLTGRDCGEAERAPMCGIPYHSADGYIAKLIAAGFKVAICEQLTDPSEKGLVERDVVRVITSGTLMDSAMLNERQNNFIASIYLHKETVGLCWCDISTGELYASEFSGKDALRLLQDNLIRISPKEILCNGQMLDASGALSIAQNRLPKFNLYYEWTYGLTTAELKLKTQLKVNNLKSFGIQERLHAISAAGSLLEYLTETQKRALSQINKISYVSDDKFLRLDIQTRKNLELIENNRDKKRVGSLLWLLDNTVTSMGGRRLLNIINEPICDGAEINLRLNAVEELINEYLMRETLKEELIKIKDIERLCCKISYGSILPKECETLCFSLNRLPKIKDGLKNAKSDRLKEIYGDIEDLGFAAQTLFKAIAENPPAQTKDGGYIKEGYDAELDELVSLSKNGKNYITGLEAKEKEKTGIKNLKIGFNRIFGYYIEVPKSNVREIPLEYIRKQTMFNAERYITEELKLSEEKIFSAEEKALRLEKQLYSRLIDTMSKYVASIQKTSKAIAELDSLLSFSLAAIKHGFTKPQISNDIKHIKISEGRHPIVEAYLKSGQFVSNDTFLDDKDDRTMILTGPNMAGKSTYMRQVALITLLAHMGSFVPAKSAQIGICDSIFTRIGASDDLAFNQSTFMVEMTEVANILNNASADSLIVLDEIGRGTSTFDGLSIAWSVMEYLSKNIYAKTLFATHYHELTELEGVLEGVKNYHIGIKEIDNTIIFLHKIMRGGESKSFGIEVAALAGLPKTVIDRAKEILQKLDAADINKNKG